MGKYFIELGEYDGECYVLPDLFPNLEDVYTYLDNHPPTSTLQGATIHQILEDRIEKVDYKAGARVDGVMKWVEYVQ